MSQFRQVEGSKHSTAPKRSPTASSHERLNKVIIVSSFSIIAILPSARSLTSSPLMPLPPSLSPTGTLTTVVSRRSYALGADTGNFWGGFDPLGFHTTASFSSKEAWMTSCLHSQGRHWEGLPVLSSGRCFSCPVNCTDAQFSGMNVIGWSGGS
ncbi:hypothetical protein B0H11DRAFT_1087709 [Mycena galericulata]|nr:hypothetical protein B0H11DRAFT_838206 [Mycena galericulata]KAJ7487392.1 hypothetical protein B0H11DRAFT_1087709 [Mycena galericulata]